VLHWAGEHQIAGLLVDTAVKDGRGLLDHLDPATLHELRGLTRQRGLLLALAGSLDEATMIDAAQVGPDLIAVRGAACVAGDRQGHVSTARVRALGDALEAVASRAALPAG
jgi:hypothetical protein